MESSKSKKVFQPQTRKNSLTFFLLILLLISTAIALYFAYTTHELSKEIIPSPSRTKQANQWKTYKNDFYGLELKYPTNFTLAENSEQIEISSPLSKCSPKLKFNLEEYEKIHELQIYLIKRSGSLEKVLEAEGGETYGWKQMDFNGRRGYFLTYGAEMITPVQRYLIETQPKEVLEIKIYVFASDDLGKCIPRLDFTQANTTKDRILSSFTFTQ